MVGGKASIQHMNLIVDLKHIQKFCYCLLSFIISCVVVHVSHGHGISILTICWNNGIILHCISHFSHLF